ncbi:transcriptional repressor [Candidatus Formimonas warabiya]|uniref:Transcriptional repressor n=1 Tax=Formimonas warabiya TaxID=1761012 RepID=A0A3G1L1T0_FORW1|nr:transcriptional repressor [Candidatus Formimonas warabiya]
MSHELIRRKIRPSHQRIKILDYLMNQRCHPTVDQIFHDLHQEIPTLSKSTVYNTLNAFLEAQLIRVITIEDHETRYDIAMKNHGHFKCDSCGSIYDFTINIDDFATGELNGFQITDKNIYFKGICPRCSQGL